MTGGAQNRLQAKITAFLRYPKGSFPPAPWLKNVQPAGASRA
jgi:hypothetical protein